MNRVVVLVVVVVIVLVLLVVPGRSSSQKQPQRRERLRLMGITHSDRLHGVQPACMNWLLCLTAQIAGLDLASECLFYV
jgi:hypothetical protein